MTAGPPMTRFARPTHGLMNNANEHPTVYAFCHVWNENGRFLSSQWADRMLRAE